MGPEAQLSRKAAAVETRMRIGMRVAWLGAACALLLPGIAAARPGHQTLLTGFNDFSAFQSTEENRTAAIRNMRAAGGSVVRLLHNWSVLARVQPPTSAAAQDPAFPGYDFSSLDAEVRDLADARLRVLLELSRAPSWAEGPGRPPVSSTAVAGTWKPDPGMFRDFAIAVARRYSGRFPDPARPGQILPRVRYYQAWNEPNLSQFITPLGRREGGRWVDLAAGWYRKLLNAFYSGINSVDPSNVVVAAGNAPVGDLGAPSFRIPPARFVRDLLCVSGRRRPRARRSCDDLPVRFDVLAQHSYPPGAPDLHAVNPDDVEAADFSRVLRPLNAAVRAGTVRPKRRKPLWATEISWDSSPPDPNGVPERVRAGYVAGALHVLWRQGVRVVTWWNLRDDARAPRGWGYSLQSGIYFRGDTVAQDRPKLGFKAFRFPFTVARRSRVAELWALAPRGGPVRIQRRQSGGWRTIAVLRARRDRLTLGELRGIPKHARLRAVQHPVASLPWRVR